MCEKMAGCERSVIHLTAHDRQCTADSTCMLGCGSANRVVHVVHIHGFVVVAAAAERVSGWSTSWANQGCAACKDAMSEI